MSILLKLHEKLKEIKKVTEHEPTHTEYPDFVRGYFYRIHSIKGTSSLGDIHSIVTANFVLMRNAVHEELGFNVGYKSGMGVKGGSQLSFLRKEDAYRFIDKYLSYVEDEVEPYISVNATSAMRIDNYANVPCYVDNSFVRSEAERRTGAVSPNLAKRLDIENPQYVTNPFINDDPDLGKIYLRNSGRNSKLIPKIEQKLSIMKEFCSKITNRFDYKNTVESLQNKKIATGEIDKQVTPDIGSIWKVGWLGHDHLEALVTTNDRSAFFGLDASSYELTLDFDKIDKKTKEMFNIKIFRSSVLKKLGENYASTDKRRSFTITPKALSFDLYSAVEVDNITNLDGINSAISEATRKTKEALAYASDIMDKSVFTIDAFDEEDN